MENQETGAPNPEQELTREQRLQIAKDLVILPLKEEVDRMKEAIKESKEWIRKDISLAEVSIMEAFEGTIEWCRARIEQVKKSNFFYPFEFESKIHRSIYDYYKYRLDGSVIEIQRLKNKKDDPGDPEGESIRKEQLTDAIV